MTLITDEVVVQDREPASDEEIIARLKAVENQEPESKKEFKEEPQGPEWDMRKLQGMDELKTWDEAKGGIGKMYQENESDPTIEAVSWEEAKSGVRAAWTREDKEKMETRRRARLINMGFSPDTVMRT